MADRFPLIVDSSNQNIKELPDGDSLLLGDSEKIRFGDGQDLDIYHDGSHSYVSDVGTGGLKLTGGDIYIRNTSDADMIHATSGGHVKLYFNASEKLATASGGVSVTGEVAATSLDISGDIDVDGTANLDNTDIHGTLNT